MNLNLTNILIISFLVSAIIFFAFVIFGGFVFGQVFLEEDQAMVCLRAVWTPVVNDISCRVFNLDDIKNIRQVYSEIMQEKDTFSLEMLK